MKVTFTIEAEVPEYRTADTYSAPRIGALDDAYHDAVNVRIISVWPGSASDPTTGPRCDRCGCWVHGHDDWNCGGPAQWQPTAIIRENLAQRDKVRGYGPGGKYSQRQWEAFPGEHYHFTGCGCNDAPAEVTEPDGTVLTCPDIPLDKDEIGDSETCPHDGGKIRFGQCRDCKCIVAG